MRNKFDPLTKKQEQKIRTEYLIKSYKLLARELGISDGRVKRLLKKWGLKLSRKIVEKRRRSTQFKKGNISMNKGKKQIEYMTKEGIERSKATRFQPGSKPANTKYDGYERIDEDGYVLMRIGNDKFVHKHTYQWKKKNGKIPKGHCLNCVDGNRANCDPDNWKLVSRQEHMLKNSKHKFPKEVIPSMVLLGKIAKKIKNIKDGTK